MDDLAFAVANRLRQRFQKVLIFGSRAKGTAREDSDVDIIVVDSVFRDKSLLERMDLVLDVVQDFLDKGIDFDIVALTPEEYSEKIRTPTNIVGYVVQRGEAIEV